MARELSCRSFVLMPQRGAVPVEDLNRAETETWHENMRRRLGEDLGAFYAQHPELLKE